MAQQLREKQGKSNPAEPPPDVCIDLDSKDMATDQACRHSRNTSKEVREDGSSEGTSTKKASDDDHKTAREVHEDGGSEGKSTDKASDDDHKTTREVHEDGSSKGTSIDKASHDDHKTAREIHQDGSSKGMVTDKASQISRKTTREVHEEGSSESAATLSEDFKKWWEQKRMPESKVSPRAVVKEDSRSLFEAAVKGDWKTIEKKIIEKEILNVKNTVMTAKDIATESVEMMTAEDITAKSVDFTILDVAIMAGQDQLVEKLVKHFPPKCEDLKFRTALAAKRGRIRMVKALIDKVDTESGIINKALEFASRTYAPNQKEVIWYLARRPTSSSSPVSKFTMVNLIVSGHFDICMYLVRKCPGLMTFQEADGMEYFQILVMMTRHFRSGAKLNFWEKSIYKFIPLCLVGTSLDDSKDTKMAQALLALNQILISLWNLATIPAPFIKRRGELKFRHNCSLDFTKLILAEMKKSMSANDILESLLTSGVVLRAACLGVLEIVDLCLKNFPELMWDVNFTKDLMKEIVKGRHVELFRLVSGQNPLQYFPHRLNRGHIELMEAVTKWSPRCVSPDISGAAFLMQRELQWFQAVEVNTDPANAWLKSQADSETYWETFVEQRKELLQEAGKWMKGTSSSCILVATLIITIALAAILTVPGGNNSSTGIPIFLKNSSFMVFAVAVALALFCSVTATLMFLAILTSRYLIEDFHHSLPRKMILGLTFLFLSLAFMLVVFGSSLTIVLSERWKCIYIPATLLVVFPVVLFAILQLPLYIEMVKSTYRPRLYRPLKLWK